MFKKFLVLLFLLPLTLTISYAQDGDLAPSEIPGEVYYAPYEVNITLDGEIDDWDGVPRVLLSGASHSMVFAVAADDTYLYALGDVTDETIISGEHGSDYWNEDSLEFYFNGSGDLQRRNYGDGVSQITIPALNKDLPSEEAVIGGIQGSSLNPQIFVTETGVGYRVELAIPLHGETWDVTPTHGGIIGFQVHLNASTSGSRDSKLIWSNADTSDQSYQNPSVFGYLMFFDRNETEIPELPEIIADVLTDLPAVPAAALYRNGSISAPARLIDLLSRMSLEEKIAQMTLIEIGSIRPEDVTTYGIGGVLSGGGGYPRGNNTAEAWAEMVDSYAQASLDSRLGIPVIYGVDAVHGHNNLFGATIFPHNIGLGATRNADLVEEICHATALEMIATGIYWDYSPVLAVVQDVRWGRSYESFGENTELVTELSTACLNGLQGESLADPMTVLGTPKHYVGDGGAQWGTSTTGDYMIDQGVTDIDEETLREVHLAPYLDAIENNAQSIMISFSSWGGMKMHAQDYLINEVLKGELGFEGFIVSDWAGIDQISTDYYESVVISINAGVDMVMVPYDADSFMYTLLTAVNNGDVSIARIDDAVSRILTVKFNMGLFENPFSNPDLLETVGSDEHRELARQAVAESQVLLKNDGDLLPLSPEIEQVFVAGVAADDIGIQSGGWTIEWQGGVGEITEGTTILEGIMAGVSDTTEVVYAADGDFEGETASVGIVVVGERPYAEGMGDDGELVLLPEDMAAIEAMQEAVDQVIVVIVSGRPLIITDYIDGWDAVVASWLPGTEGAGVADVLLGAQPFTGTLPVTWISSVDQLPHGSTDEEPLFPYGWGLTTE